MALQTPDQGASPGVTEKEKIDLIYEHIAAPDSNRRVIIRIEPRVQTRLHLLIFKGFDTSQNTTTQNYSLGDLDVFPDLVLSMVCLKLDIMSAFRFSQTSHGPRKFIAHILEFRRVREHATETLFALLGTSLAKHFTIFDLYSVLCSGDCATCGLSGGFAFLPTLKRTCMHCATKSSTTDIVSLNALSKQSQISATQLKRSLPVLHTLSGQYGRTGVIGPQMRRIFLTSRSAALEYFRTQGIAEPAAAIPYRPTSGAPMNYCFMALTELPFLSKSISLSSSYNSVSCVACAIAVRLQLREPDYLGWGSYEYTPQRFMNHFRSCAFAKKYWAVHKGQRGLPMRLINAIDAEDAKDVTGEVDALDSRVFEWA